MESTMQSMETVHQNTSKLNAWIVIFSAAGFFFYQFMLINIFNALNEPMLREFNITATHLGHVSASYFIAGGLSLLMAGAIVDRLSVRKVLLSALSVSIVSMFLFSIATSPSYALMARFLAGISGTFCFIGPMKLISRFFPYSQQALVIGLIVSYAMLGGIVAQTPITVLAETLGWRTTSQIISFAGLFFLALIFWNVKDHPQNSSVKLTRYQIDEQPNFLHALRKTITKRQNYLSGLYICLINLPIYLIGAMWGTLYLTQVHQLTRVQSSYVTSMIFVGMILGSPTMGWLSDRIGLRKKPMVFFGLISIVPFIVLLSAGKLSLAPLMLIFFSIGFLISVQVIAYPLISESNPHEYNGIAQGLASTIVILGGLTQPLFGKIMSLNWDNKTLNGIALYSASDYQWAILIMPIAMIVAVLSLLFVKETYCK